MGSNPTEIEQISNLLCFQSNPKTLTRLLNIKYSIVKSSELFMFSKIFHALLILITSSQVNAANLSITDLDFMISHFVPGQENAARLVEKALVEYTFGLGQAVVHKTSAEAVANRILAEYRSYDRARIYEYDVQHFFEDARDSRIPFFDFAQAKQQGNSVLHIIGPKGSGQSDIIDVIERFEFVPVVRIDFGLSVMPALTDFTSRLQRNIARYKGTPFILAMENIETVPTAYRGFVANLINDKAFLTDSGKRSVSLADVLIITTRSFSDRVFTEAAKNGVAEMGNLLRASPGLERHELMTLADLLDPRSFDAWLRSVSPVELAALHNIPLGNRASDAIVALNSSIEPRELPQRGMQFSAGGITYASDAAIHRSIDYHVANNPVFSEMVLVEFRLNGTYGDKMGYTKMLSEILEHGLPKNERARLVGNQELFKWSGRIISSLVEVAQAAPLDERFNNRIESIKFLHSSGGSTQPGRIAVTIKGIPKEIEFTKSEIERALGSSNANDWPSRTIELDLTKKGINPSFELLGHPVGHAMWRLMEPGRTSHLQCRIFL